MSSKESRTDDSGGGILVELIDPDLPGAKDLMPVPLWKVWGTIGTLPVLFCVVFGAIYVVQKNFEIQAAGEGNINRIPTAEGSHLSLAPHLDVSCEGWFVTVAKFDPGNSSAEIYPSIAEHLLHTEFTMPGPQLLLSRFFCVSSDLRHPVEGQELVFMFSPPPIQ